MFAKTLIAAATAATISLGALGATTTAASAQEPGGWAAPARQLRAMAVPAIRRPRQSRRPRRLACSGSGQLGRAPYPGPRGAYFGGPNWRVAVRPPMRQVCAPTFRTIKVFKPYYGWVFTQVYAGQQCYWRAAW